MAHLLSAWQGVRTGAPSFPLWAFVVSRGEGVAQLELEKNVPIDRIVADGFSPAGRRDASLRIGDLLSASSDVELALAAFVVFDGAVQGIAAVPPKISQLQ
jgi:hypothetical protein